MERNLIQKELYDLSLVGKYNFEQSPFFDVTRAVSENRKHSATLGWENHPTAIGKYIFMNNAAVDEVSFAKELAAWQRKNGLTANGILDESVWEMMRLFIPKKSPEKVIAGWKGDFVRSLSPAHKKNLIQILRDLDKSPIKNKYTKAAVLAVSSKESGFKLIEEITYANTDVSNIRNIFGNVVKDLTDVELEQLKKNEKRFFNHVYGNLNGNAANEGFLYRGRGFNQLTFKDNYRVVGKLIDVDLVSNPDLLMKLPIASKAMPAYFISRFMSKSAPTILNLYNSSGIDGFSDLKDAVMACFHANAGWGKTAKMLSRYKTLWNKSKNQVSRLTIEELKNKIPNTRKNNGKRNALTNAPEFLKLIETLEELVD